MTTKYRIICGFMIMVLLMAVNSWLGYDGAKEALRRSDEYRRLAVFNAATSDLTTALNGSAYYVFRFLDNGENRELASARAQLDVAARQLQLSQSVVLRQDRKEKLAALESGRQKLLSLLNAMEKDFEAFNALTRKDAPQIVAGVMESIHALNGIIKDRANGEAAYRLNEATAEIGGMREAFTRYIESRNAQAGEIATARLAQAQAKMEEAGQTLKTAEGRAAIDGALKSLADYKGMLGRAAALVGNIDKNLGEQGVLLERQNKAAAALSEEVDKNMSEFGAATTASLKGAQSGLVTIGGAGLLLGVICAVVIIVLLSKTLARLSVFAREIARGNFSAELKIREKGEIGTVAQSIRAIPDTLKRMAEEYRNLEKRVEEGYLNVQGDAAAFSGEFASIVQGANNILKRMGVIFDNIPSPMVVLNKDLKAAYLNREARDLAGADYAGKTCGEMFCREDYGTSSCGLMNAVNTNKICSGETVARPRGRRLDVRYTAIPMHDARGALVSVLQFIVDLTQIKDTERKIMTVASQAQEISDRVAAASEELAAQVEQVSRGAEVQRGRMESTVSAMTEMNATVLEVARSAGQASEQSENTRKKAEDGAGLVNRVVNSINAVNNVAVNLQSNMQELGRQAESIGGVMNVISDIADQTNLLALNAAIEAARAGEAGRGFAVVADEVRKLAEKTMQATKEVGDNISAIQSSAHKNIGEVDNAVKSVVEATELANSSGAALREIVDLAAANSGVVTSIATAAEEQSATSEEINLSLDEINRIVGETADGMVQSSSAVQDLSATAQQLKRVMDDLRKG